MNRRTQTRYLWFTTFCLMSAAGGPAHSATDLFVVLRLEEPATLTGKLRFERPGSSVRFASGRAELRKLLASEECKPDETGLKRCHLLETVGRTAADACVAVLLDSAGGDVELRNFLIRRGPTEEQAVRKAFFGSRTYDSLYFEQRLLNPFREVEIIDEQVFTDGEKWADRYLGSTCRD